MFEKTTTTYLTDNAGVSHVIPLNHPGSTEIRDTARRRLEVATLAAREVWRRSPKGSIEKWENPGGVHEWWKATWLDWGLGGDFLLVGEIMENHRDGSYLSGNMWKTNEFFPRQTIWKWWVVHIYLNVYRMLGLFRLSHIIQAWRIGWWPMKPSRHRAGYGRIGRRGGVQRKPSKNKKRNLPRWPKTTQWEQKRLNCQQCQKIAPICFQSPRAQSRPQQAHRAVKACYAFTEQIQRSTDAKAAFPDHWAHRRPKQAHCAVKAFFAFTA